MTLLQIGKDREKKGHRDKGHILNMVTDAKTVEK